MESGVSKDRHVTCPVRMVDVSGKPVMSRFATAHGRVTMAQATVRLLEEDRLPKGNVLAAAQVAGILAAKRVDEWIPLCHTLPLDSVEITFVLDAEGVVVTSDVGCHGKTGVEMEALTAVAVSCLTIYDMCKSIDKEMTIGPIYLLKKSGGRSGDYLRPSRTEGRDSV